MQFDLMEIVLTTCVGAGGILGGYFAKKTKNGNGKKNGTSVMAPCELHVGMENRLSMLDTRFDKMETDVSYLVTARREEKTEETLNKILTAINNLPRNG